MFYTYKGLKVYYHSNPIDLYNSRAYEKVSELKIAVHVAVVTLNFTTLVLQMQHVLSIIYGFTAVH